MRVLCLLIVLSAPAIAESLDALVRANFQPHLEAGDFAGAAVATVQGGSIDFHYFGKANLETGVAVDEKSLFEIGSITKVMTGTLLALAIEDGAVQLDTPVASLLPPGNTVPQFEGRPISLVDLATHSSGLPRLPSNWLPADGTQPYVDYGADALYAFLNSYELPRAPGKQYEYSNLGTALLGHALALKAGKPYAELLRDELFSPLGMNNSHIASNPEQLQHAATGYTATQRILFSKRLEPRAMWAFDVFQSAGAVRSTIVDMAKFLKACISQPDSRLGKAMRSAQSPVHFTVNEQLALALNWHILKRGEAPAITWHNGQTGGYHAFLGLNASRQTGIAVLCNTDFDIDPLAFRLLDAMEHEKK